MIFFTPPGRREHRGNHPLFSRLTFTQGLSLLKEDGLYRQAEFPSDDELVAADVVYLGGHVYPVSAEEAADLESAGYGAWLDEQTPPAFAYGEGPYGEGLYGGVV